MKRKNYILKCFIIESSWRHVSSNFFDAVEDMVADVMEQLGPTIAARIASRFHRVFDWKFLRDASAHIEQTWQAQSEKAAREAHAAAGNCHFWDTTWYYESHWQHTWGAPASSTSDKNDDAHREAERSREQPTGHHPLSYWAVGSDAAVVQWDRYQSAYASEKRRHSDVPSTKAEFTFDDLARLLPRIANAPTVPIQWPPRNRDCPVDLTWKMEKGRFLWNFQSQKPAPVVRRESGSFPVVAINAGRRKDIEVFVQTGGSLGEANTSSEEALRRFLIWLSYRSEGAKKIRDVTLGKPPGVNWSRGWWLRLGLATTDYHAEEVLDLDMRRSYHGTTLHSLHRILVEGLKEGFAANTQSGKEIHGIFSHRAETSHLCLGYTLYSPIDRSGWMWGPFVELLAPANDPHGRPITLKRRSGPRAVNQWISYEDTTVMQNIWVNALHMGHLLEPDPTWGFSINVEGYMHPELELNPQTSWVTLTQRSRQNKDVVL